MQPYNYIICAGGYRKFKVNVQNLKTPGIFDDSNSSDSLLPRPTASPSYFARAIAVAGNPPCELLNLTELEPSDTMHGNGQGTTHETAQSILAFASHLQKSLDPEYKVSARLPDPSGYLRAFPLPQAEISPNRVALDRKGTQLWNLCRKLGWTKVESEQRYVAQSGFSDFERTMMLMDIVRALAFFMIESAQERNCNILSGDCYLRAYLDLADLYAGRLRLARTGLAAAKCFLCSCILNLKMHLLIYDSLQAT